MNGLDAVNYVQKWVSDYSQWIQAHNHIIVLTRFVKCTIYSFEIKIELEFQVVEFK